MTCLVMAIRHRGKLYEAKSPPLTAEELRLPLEELIALHADATFDPAATWDDCLIPERYWLNNNKSQKWPNTQSPAT